MRKEGSYMSTKSKVQKPKFIDEFEEVDKIYRNDYLDKIQNKLIKNCTTSEISEKGVEIDSCIFKNVVFEECEFPNIDIIDCRFENCDLSNVVFSSASMKRVEFVGCKLIGAKFDESSLKDVLFENVIGKYVNFSFSKLQAVNIVESNFNEGTFQEVKHKALTFIDTDLRDGYFNGTSLSKIDFTTCDINGINVDIRDLRGAIVTPMQGLELTRLLGLEIK